MRTFKKGESYRPVVKIKKSKNGIPTVIEVSGNTYTLAHPDHIRGRNVSKCKQ